MHLRPNLHTLIRSSKLRGSFWETLISPRLYRPQSNNTSNQMRTTMSTSTSYSLSMLLGLSSWFPLRSRSTLSLKSKLCKRLWNSCSQRSMKFRDPNSRQTLRTMALSESSYQWTIALWQSVLVSTMLKQCRMILLRSLNSSLSKSSK